MMGNSVSSNKTERRILKPNNFLVLNPNDSNLLRPSLPNLPNLPNRMPEINTSSMKTGDSRLYRSSTKFGLSQEIILDGYNSNILPHDVCKKKISTQFAINNNAVFNL